jgi:hypothetical protein
MNHKTWLCGLALVLGVCGGSMAGNTVQDSSGKKTLVSTTGLAVALAGNGFVTSAGTGATETIGDTGLVNWTSASTVTSVYFRMAQAGTVAVSLDAKGSGSKASTVRVTVNGVPFNVQLSGKTLATFPVGSVNVPAAGYVKVDLQGLSRGGSTYGEVAAVRVNTSVAVNYANDAANYYWSRRGPSVHLGYTTPANTEYFYNEVTVPTGQDKIGSYFMANGFGQGYMGIQVVSPSERWVLFSVWDADNGAKTTLVNKGPGVIDNSFGGEGTGGQSHLVFNWIAGNTYRFITRAHPDGAGSTDFSAWFFAPETGAWRLIATWRRPSTTTYLTGSYSFVENFIDTNGYMGRRAQFGNQWARSTAGSWSEVTIARFTGDATATNAQRMDYAGGLESGKFYLRNGGFFADYVPTNQNFVRAATGVAPAVDVSTLP